MDTKTIFAAWVLEFPVKEKIEWEFRAIISRNQKSALRLQKSARVIGQLKFREISLVIFRKKQITRKKHPSRGELVDYLDMRF